MAPAALSVPLAPFGAMHRVLLAFEVVTNPWAGHIQQGIGGVLGVGVVSVVCSATPGDKMVPLGQATQCVFRGCLKLMHAAPSAGSLFAAFQMVDPKAPDVAVGRVLADAPVLLGDGDVIGVDGRVAPAMRTSALGWKRRPRFIRSSCAERSPECGRIGARNWRPRSKRSA